MALPFLEALSPAGRLSAQTAAGGTAATGALGPNGEPVRFATFFMPNGVNPREWIDDKAKEGQLGELPRILKPLDAVKEHMNVITGLTNPGNGHSLGTASFLTGEGPRKTSKVTEINVHNPSLDQLIGEALKSTTVFPTLELGVGRQAKARNEGSATPIYTMHLVWKDANSPIPYELNPQRAFRKRSLRRLPSTAKADKNNTPSKMPDPSVIDAVLQDAKALEKKLGKEDRHKLDEYFTAVREVEKRIAQQNAVTGLNVTEDMLKDILGLKRDIRSHMDGRDDGDFQKAAKDSHSRIRRTDDGYSRSLLLE